MKGTTQISTAAARTVMVIITFLIPTLSIQGVKQKIKIVAIALRTNVTATKESPTSYRKELVEVDNRQLLLIV